MRTMALFGALILVAGSLIATASAQTPKRKSPAEIAEVSKRLTERNESCRQQANALHLHFLKRRRFLRECRNKI